MMTINPWIALASALGGYLLGSISFARLIYRLVAPDRPVQGIVMDVAGTDEHVEVDAISGTAVSTQLGAKYGCLTALGDICKAALPALALRLYYPDAPYFLIAAAMALVGHNWPLYHRFRGGRGMSPMMGGFVVLDWIGTIVTSLLAMVLGLGVFKNVVIAYTGGIWLMIPWVWFWTRDPARVLYVVFCDLIFIVSMIPELKVMLDRRQRGVTIDMMTGMDSMPMGRGMIKMGQMIGLMKKPPAVTAAGAEPAASTAKTPE